MTNLDAPVLNIAHRALRQSNLKRPAYRRFLAAADKVASADPKQQVEPSARNPPVAMLDGCWLLAVIVKARFPFNRKDSPAQFPDVAEKLVAGLSLRRKTAAWRLINGK